jgi:hypothetical protein
MKRRLKVFPKPTKEEVEKLAQHLWMADWHFEATIKKKCTEISSHSIFWKKNEQDSHWVQATVFGLQAIKTETKESCIANIFIRYERRVYQTVQLSTVIEIIALLKKEAEFDEYKNKLWGIQWNERKKIRAAKQQEKGKIKRLKVVAKEKVA